MEFMIADDIYKLQCLNIFYKYENGNIPAYFQNMFLTQINSQIRSTRTRWAPQRLGGTQHNSNYYIETKRTNSLYCRLCIRHEIPKLIHENYLPRIVLEKINSHSYHGFVNYTRKYIINKYETECSIPNCYICNR